MILQKRGGIAMEKLTAEEIESVRQQLKTQLDELLACDELWHKRLSREILDGAREEADGHVFIAADRTDVTGLVEREHRFTLRDLIATGMVSDNLIAWAREER
jgi:hypothetical protein